MKTKINGFSLLEISIVLIIAGMLLSVSFQSAKYFLLQNHIETTKIKLNTIQDALEIYLIENNRLPCPAGLKNNTGNSLTCVNNPTDGVSSDGTIARGGIPYKELNLTADLSYDAWRTKFTYSVPVAIAVNTANFKQMSKNYTGITIQNYLESGNIEITQQALYSVVSHGINKLGGYSYENNLENVTSGITASEQVNIPENSSLTTNVYFDNPKSSIKTNDDYVRYKTRMQLITGTGINDVDCDSSSTEINTLITNYNSNIINRPVIGAFLVYNEEKSFTDSATSCNNTTNCEYIVKCYKYGRLGIYRNEQ